MSTKRQSSKDKSIPSGWPDDVIRRIEKEVASWPQWKRDLVRQMDEERRLESLNYVPSRPPLHYQLPEIDYSRC